MKIGIDARMYGEGFGLARYVKQLVDGIVDARPDDEFVFFCRKENSNTIANHPRVKKVIADIQWYSLKEQLLFGQIIKKEQVDIMHFPHWNVPYIYSGPYIVTIHDLTMFHFPRPEATTLGPLVFKVKDLAHRLLLQRVVKKAQHIITTSQFVSQDIHTTLSVPKEKMTAIYQASFPVSDIRNHDNIKKTYNIHKPYVLYVGAAYPHKQLEALLRAWEVFQETNQNHHELLLAGKRTPFYDRIMASELGHQASIRYLGMVPDDALDGLYRGATAFVFPSLSEGFGLPPLEAMARSVPVLSSPASCMPEILGDAAYYADPTDEKAFAAALVHITEDNDLQFDLRQKGKTQAAGYSWERFIKETAAVYTYAVHLEKNS